MRRLPYEHSAQNLNDVHFSFNTSTFYLCYTGLSTNEKKKKKCKYIFFATTKKKQIPTSHQTANIVENKKLFPFNFEESAAGLIFICKSLVYMFVACAYTKVKYSSLAFFFFFVQLTETYLFAYLYYRFYDARPVV